MSDSLPNHLPSVAALAPPPDVSARIRAHVAVGLGPKRGPGAALRWLFGVGTVVAAFVAVFIMTRGEPPRGLPRSLAVLITGGSLIAGATLLGLARSGTASVSVRTRIALALLPPGAFLGIVGLAHGVFPSHADAFAEMSITGCLLRAVLLAALPMAALVLLWRRTDPFTPRLTGTMIGGWAGLTGAVGLTVACPASDLWHVAIGHGGALAGGALLGFLVGRRFLSP